MAKETYYRVTIDKVTEDPDAEQYRDKQSVQQIYQQVVTDSDFNFSNRRLQDIIHAVNGFARELTIGIDSDAANGLHLRDDGTAEDGN